MEIDVDMREMMRCCGDRRSGVETDVDGRNLMKCGGGMRNMAGIGCVSGDWSFR